MLRKWLIALIREAVRAEVADHFASLEAATELIETHFEEIAIRVKEKQDQKKAAPVIGKQWGARARELEAASENKG